MVNALQVANDFAKVVNDVGMVLSAKYYTRTFTSGTFDDSPSYSQSGTTVWFSGIVQPVTFGTANTAAQNALLQQGLIKMSDKIVYLPSGIALVQNGKAVEIGLGSPNTDIFALLPEAVQVPTLINGVEVYQKAYMRRLTGSITDYTSGA